MTHDECEDFAERISIAIQELIESRIQCGSSNYSESTQQRAEELETQLKDMLHTINVSIKSNA